MSKKKKIKTNDNKNTIRSPSKNNNINTFLLEQLMQRKMMFDGFSNTSARMGQNTTNLLEGTEYQSNRLSFNWNLLNILYREHWIVRRIVDVVAEDMVKNWYKIKSQISPSDIKRINILERRTQLRARTLEGLRWARLYGGAAGVIIIQGQEDMLDKPLELDTLLPGYFKGLLILDRWNGIYPGTQIVEDSNDIDFGLPMYYHIRSDAIGTGIKVHHSRVVRFINRDLPYIEKLMESYWGASELEHIYEELKKRDNTSWNIATLIFSANLKVYQMDGFEQMALMDEQALGDLYKTLMLMNEMMNNNSMQVIGKNDTFDTRQYTFSGLSDIYSEFMMDVAGAAEMPVTKLFGRSPAGMNATGESDMQNYYDSIEQKQEACLRPVLEKLLPILCISAFGFVPDDLEIEFNNCRRPTEEERKTLAQQTASAIIEVYNSGLISQKTALKELRQSSENTGMWTNITDEDIEKASDEIAFPTENLIQPPSFLQNGVTEYEQQE